MLRGRRHEVMKKVSLETQPMWFLSRPCHMKTVAWPLGWQQNRESLPTLRIILKNENLFEIAKEARGEEVEIPAKSANHGNHGSKFIELLGMIIYLVICMSLCVSIILHIIYIYIPTFDNYPTSASMKGPSNIRTEEIAKSQQILPGSQEREARRQCLHLQQKGKSTWLPWLA